MHLETAGTRKLLGTCERENSFWPIEIRIRWINHLDANIVEQWIDIRQLALRDRRMTDIIRNSPQLMSYGICCINEYAKWARNIIGGFNCAGGKCFKCLKCLLLKWINPYFQIWNTLSTLIWLTKNDQLHIVPSVICHSAGYTSDVRYINSSLYCRTL